MQVYPVNHICDTAVKDIINIQIPLDKINGLHLLYYGRYYSDNTGFLFYTNKPYWIIRTSLNTPFQGTYKKNGIYPWSDFHSKSFIKIAEDFKIYNPVNIINPLHAGIGQEIFTFAFSDPNNPGVTFYLNNIELLNKFMVYFVKEAASLIEKAEKTKISVPTHFVGTDNEDPSYKELIGFLTKNFEVPIEYKQEASILHNLTKREIMCLCYYLMGKTAAEIAQILGMSPKTASAHLYNARIKLKCKNRSELFQKAIETGLIHTHHIKIVD